MFKDFCNYKMTVELTNALLEQGIDPLAFSRKAKKIVESNGTLEDINSLLAELSFSGVKDWMFGGKQDNPAYGSQTNPNVVGKMMGQKTQYGKPVGYDKFASNANQNFQVNKDKAADYNKALSYLHGLLQPLKNLGFNIRNIQEIIAKLQSKAGGKPQAAPTAPAAAQQPLGDKFTTLTRGKGVTA